MNAGRLRHRVVIEQATETRDANGGVIQSWGTLATVWASIEPIAGREYFDAQQTQAEIDTRIRIRHRSDVTPKMRCSFSGRTFEIKAVLDVEERSREVHLMCKEIV